MSDQHQESDAPAARSAAGRSALAAGGALAAAVIIVGLAAMAVRRSLRPSRRQGRHRRNGT